MSMLRKNANQSDPDPLDTSSPLELVRIATHECERAKRARDTTIAEAKASGTASLRELAEAAGLSVSRVKQLATGPISGGATLPGVAEMDLSLDDTSLGDAAHGDRIFAIDDVDPWLRKWASEREFLDADPRRHAGDRWDIAYKLYDLELASSWTAVYQDNTREVYAFVNNSERLKADTGESNDGFRGSRSGPCVLLGHCYTRKYLDAGLNAGSAHNILRRPGGIAWIYGRICLLNRLLAALPACFNEQAVSDYLDGLRPSERPS